MSDTRTDAEESVREPEELVGRTIASKYEVTRMIGRGGMGAVYEAEHVGIGRKVAIKFVDRDVANDEGVVTRFAREARATTAIDSEHIVSVLDAGVEDGRPYLVMELLRGEDLGARLRRLGRLTVKESLHILAQVLRGLARAHEAGIVHRDLKPDNVFVLRRENDALFVKIVDFGISKMSRPKSGTTPLAITGKGTVLGTPLYMAPEQAQALPDVDGRADLYSAGAILFECLTGRPPHTGECYEQIILAICMQDAPDVRSINSTVPANVSAYVARCLARNRDARYGSAFEALAGLREVAPEETLALLTPANGDDATSLPFAATQPMGALTGVSWTAGGTSRKSAPRVTQRRTHGGVRVAATALLAMVTGVALTTWLLRVAPTRDPAAVDGVASSGPASSVPVERPKTAETPKPVDAPGPVANRGPALEVAAADAPAGSDEARVTAVVDAPTPPLATPKAGSARRSTGLPKISPAAQVGGGRDTKASGVRPSLPSGGLDLQRDFP